MLVREEFEEFPFEYEGKKMFLWFTCYACIETKIHGNGIDEEQTSESSFKWLDVLNIEGAWSLERAEEGYYFDVDNALVRALERSLDISDFEI